MIKDKNILYIYTADDAVIAIRKAEKLFIDNSVGKKTSKTLLEHIKNLLNSCNLSVEDLNAVCVVNGVGSFTGLRVGLTVAKTMSFMLNIPLVSCTNIELVFKVKNTKFAVVPAYAGGAFVGDKKTIKMLNKNDFEKFLLENKNDVAYLKDINDKDDLSLLTSIAEEMDSLCTEKLAKNRVENPLKLDAIYVEKSRAEDELENDLKNIKIRKATKKDVESMACIDRSCFSCNIFTKQNFEEFIETKNNNIFVLEFKNEIAGFIMYSQVLDECNIYSVAIVPKHQGKGLSKKLMEKFLDDCKKNNIKSIFLEVNENNKVAQNLYKKFGFDIIGIRNNYYENGDNAITMKYSF